MQGVKANTGANQDTFSKFQEQTNSNLRAKNEGQKNRHGSGYQESISCNNNNKDVFFKFQKQTNSNRHAKVKVIKTGSVQTINQTV